MFVSDSFWVSLALAIVTMVTWGTNKIAVKYLTYPVSLYTIDFFVWVFIFHTILSLTVGAGWFPSDPSDTFSNILDILRVGGTTAWVRIGGPFVAGATTMGFTLVMFVLVDGYGLTSAIPLLFGSSMVIGVIITYLMDPKGNVWFIFSGVAVLFVAVVMNTIASNMNQKCQKKEEEKPLLENAPQPAEITTETQPIVEATAETQPVQAQPAEVATETQPTEATVAVAAPTRQLSMTAFVLLGLLGALCDVFYAPCTAMGGKQPYRLSPYGIFEIVSIASAIFVFPFAYIVMRKPLKGPKCTYSDWIHATWKQRWPAIWSAALLALGNVGYASAGNALGYAIGYALSRGTLLVSALLGIFAYKEFKNADCKTWFVLSTSLLLFLTAILLEAFATN